MTKEANEMPYVTEPNPIVAPAPVAGEYCNPVVLRQRALLAQLDAEIRGAA